MAHWRHILTRCTLYRWLAQCMVAAAAAAIAAMLCCKRQVSRPHALTLARAYTFALASRTNYCKRNDNNNIGSAEKNFANSAWKIRTCLVKSFSHQQVVRALYLFLYFFIILLCFFFICPLFVAVAVLIFWKAFADIFNCRRLSLLLLLVVLLLLLLLLLLIALKLNLIWFS